MRLPLTHITAILLPIIIALTTCVMIIGYSLKAHCPLSTKAEARHYNQTSNIHYCITEEGNPCFGSSYKIQYEKEYPINSFPPISPGQDTFE